MTTSLPHGPFTSAAALECGVTARVLDRLVRDLVVRRVMRNVYQRYDEPDTIEHRVAAARLVVTPASVLCDRTAAWLHGVDIFDYRELEILPPVETVVLRGRSRIERPECRGGERDLAPYDVMRIGGIPVTTPLRTALDLGCLLPRGDGLAALDMFMRLHGVTRGELMASLPRYRRRRGVVRLRPLVMLADPRSESPAESWLRLVLHDEGFPPPEPQHWVVHEGVALFRLDFAYPKHRIAVEYDGEWHRRTEGQREADRRRRQWLRDHGWTVVVVQVGELSPAGRQRWVGELRDALAAR